MFAIYKEEIYFTSVLFFIRERARREGAGVNLEITYQKSSFSVASIDASTRPYFKFKCAFS